MNKKWHGSGNSSCKRCELDLYIDLSNVHGCRLFLSVDLNGLAQIEQLVVLLYSLHCNWVSRLIGILLAMCCLQMVAAAKICYKNFSAASSLYLLGMVQGIVHHYISCRCNSYMVRVAGIRWWRILMTMAHTSLVFIERFWNSHRWQKVNAVGILFL